MGRKLQRVNRNTNIDAANTKITVTSSKSSTKVNSDLKHPFTRTQDHEMWKGISSVQDIFPFWLPWILFPLTFCFRLFYILLPTNWWILHPDEIFQTIEVAHTEAFGYGFRPYEYLPPPKQDSMNSTMLSSANEHDIRHGMYSLRSFLLPQLFAIVMSICNTFGVSASPFLIVKIFHITVTSLLPVAVYKFSRSLQQSKDVSCLSAILVCSSLTLNIFATHTFINSFLASFFFLSFIPLVNSFDMTDASKIACESNSSLIHNPVRLHVKRNDEHHEKVAKFLQFRHRNFHKTSSRTNAVFKLDKTSHDVNIFGVDGRRKASNSSDSGYEEIEDHISAKKQTNYGVNDLKFSNKMLELVSGLGLALCLYIRVDISMIIFLVLVTKYINNVREIAKLFKSKKGYLLGVSCGIIFGAYCDYVTYGRWFLAPYQWYKFNVLNSFAGKLFGVECVYFYLLTLYKNEPLALLSFVIILIDIIQDLKTQTFNLSHVAKNQNLFIFALLFFAFSINSHKEHRFIHNAIIFMYMSVSVAILSIMKRFSQNQKQRQYSIFSIYLFITLFTSSQLFYFYNMTIADRAKWTYGKITDSHETNICLDFIRQQKDVSGIFMDRSVHMSGAYSILHHDVPIFALNIFEFMEYKSDRHSVISTDLNVSTGNHKGFSTFNDISDFISIYNTQYLHRKIRETTMYNFLILNSNSNFNSAGYDEIFRTGDTKVLFRTFDEKKEMILKMETAKVKLLLNATILEYEGSWLKHYGLYTKAEQRLLMSNNIDPRRINTFRILLEMYSKLKYTDDYKSVLSACLQLYLRSECLKPFIPIEFHHGYYRKL